VVAITFTIELSGNTAEMHLCLPYSMVEPIRDVLYSTMHSEQASADKRWTGTLTKQLQTAEVPLVVTLGDARSTFGQIMAMKVGDVIPLDMGPLVQAKVDGVPVLECRYGIQNGAYALKIQRFLAEEES
jgi:flagellar motor switch protein FliM